VETATACTIYGDAEGDQIGVAANLDVLADNGGPTPTHRLLPGSPAIDGGSADGCATFDDDPITVDQRGVPRPQGDACDIGAFEDACGNGTVDAGEQCDDGNRLDGDCCSAGCRYEAGLDVDGDGVAEVARDVVYIARSLFGIVPVPPSFRMSDPAIPDDGTITAAIDAGLDALDVDASGAVGVATDLVYVARHLFGLPPVPPSFRSSDPAIPSDEVIAATIDHLCPLRMPPARPGD
jgi:cysteine-rich repeat protein